MRTKRLSAAWGRLQRAAEIAALPAPEVLPLIGQAAWAGTGLPRQAAPFALSPQSSAALPAESFQTPAAPRSGGAALCSGFHIYGG